LTEKGTVVRHCLNLVLPLLHHDGGTHHQGARGHLVVAAQVEIESKFEVKLKAVYHISVSSD
jgi:hypothetical protein